MRLDELPAVIDSLQKRIDTLTQEVADLQSQLRQEEVMNCRQVARYLHVSTDQVNEWRIKGKLRTLHTPKKVLYLRSDVDRMFETETKKERRHTTESVPTKGSAKYDGTNIVREEV